MGLLVTAVVLGSKAAVWARGARSEPLEPWVLVAGLGLACLVVAALVGESRARRRAVEIAHWARVHDWTYQGRSLALPGPGGREVLHGVVNDVEMTSYTGLARAEVNGGKPVLEHHVLVARLPTRMPTLSIGPELRGPAAELVPDVTLEAAAFNARWRVRCADARFAHAFCHPRLMERLMRADAAGVSIHVEGRDVAVSAPGVTDLLALPARAALLADVVRLVPPYLADDHAAEPLVRRPRPATGPRRPFRRGAPR